MTEIENELTELNSMVRPIMSSKALNIDDTDSLVPVPLDTDEELI